MTDIDAARASWRRFAGAARVVYAVDFLIWIVCMLFCGFASQSGAPADAVLLVVQAPFFFWMTRLAERAIVRSRCARSGSPHSSLFEELACVDDPSVSESGLARWIYRIGLSGWNAMVFVFLGAGFLFGPR